jgi:hypothetical protein
MSDMLENMEWNDLQIGGNLIILLGSIVAILTIPLELFGAA